MDPDFTQKISELEKWRADQVKFADKSTKSVVNDFDELFSQSMTEKNLKLL